MLESIKLVIVFGSQTGTSEDLAERIGREVNRRHVQSEVCSMNAYDHSNLIKEKLVLFVCSTTGQGEEPDNMKSFWRLLLRKMLPANLLENLSYGVIGLGDSSYTKFNFVAKKLHKRLLQLGAVPLLNPALGDDQHELGLDAAVDPWLEQFWVKLASIYPRLQDVERIQGLLPSKHQVNLNKDNYIIDSIQQKPLDECSNSFPAQVLNNERLTDASHFQDVRFVQFSIPSEISYSPGDVAVLRPCNPEESVDEFLNLLGLEPEQIISVTKDGRPVHLNVSQPCTLKQCAKHHWDIKSIPKRSFFELLQYFGKDETEREKLNEFTTSAGQEELYSYCNRPRRSILEVLQDFPHTAPHIPLEYLFELIPPIRPRYFSIASSPSAHPGQLHLLVAVVRYRTRLHKPRLGLCSNWIAELKPTKNIEIAVRKGSFIMPAEHIPVVLVGPGTGVAPFRSFIQERTCKGIGNNLLFFGNRSKEADFLCRAEWDDLSAKGLLKLHTAFSRDQDYKIYVQHRILEEGQTVWSLMLEGGAWILIAGSAKDMPQDVKKALENVVQKYGGFSKEQAKAFLTDMERKNHLQYEVWG